MDVLINVLALAGFGVLLTAFLYAIFRKKLERTESQDIKSLVHELAALREEVGAMNVLLASKDKLLHDVEREKEELHALLDQEAEKNRKILSQKKSSEVRTGLIAEQLTPLLMGDHHDIRTLKFLGQPIDYLAFDKEGVFFIEVKSGKSQLSYNQKQIKRLIQDKKVFWEELRINSKGVTSVVGNKKKKL
jgi:predicted Holliday junction resolvase-like endonuclease